MLKQCYTKQTEQKHIARAIEKWGKKHNGTRKESNYRNIGWDDIDYTNGDMQQDELHTYETTKKTYPYTMVEWTVEDTEAARDGRREIKKLYKEKARLFEEQNPELFVEME